MNLKLKVWDKLNSQMFKVLQITFDRMGLPYLKVGVIADDDKGNRFNLAIENVEILQYIGEKDKIGEEIYYGDILQTNEADWIGRVIFNFGGFILIDKHGGFSIEPEWRHCVILGNIYQNYELFKGGK